MNANIDGSIYNLIYNLSASTTPAKVIAVICASGLIWFLIIWYIEVSLKQKKSGPREFFTLILGSSMVYLFNIIVSILWWRPRPFLMMTIEPLINVGITSKSFPSDHASLAFFIAFLLHQYNKKWWWAYVLACLVALGRVAVGVHYPSDVLAGAVVGLLFGYLTSTVEKLFSKQAKS